MELFDAIGENYTVTFKVSRIIKEYADDYFKIFVGNIQNFMPVSPGNTFPLNGSEVMFANTPSLIVGNTYSGTVTVVASKQHGISLSLKGELELVYPENENDYRSFLEKTFKGIGKTYSKRLMDLFGMSVIENIINNKRALALAGIPVLIAEQMRTTAVEMGAMNHVIGFFNEFNIPVSVATAVYDALGASTLQQIQVNPWAIASHNHQYFKFADLIANRLGFEATHKHRLSTGLLSYLKNRMNAGHMAIYERELYESDAFKGWLAQTKVYSEEANAGIPDAAIQAELHALIDNWVLETPTNQSGETLVYFRKTLRTEDSIISGVAAFLSGDRLPIGATYQVDQFITALEAGAFLSKESKKYGIKPFSPAEEQRQGIQMAITEPLSILTGGPGTGKTTVVNTIVQAIEYLAPGASISMLAPTGKAAKRMAEITNRPAMTIHRKLNMQMSENDDELVEIEDDYVIVDESSMVDAHLFASLITNVSPQTRILLVGDVDQLPSVGSGAILRDLIDSGAIPTTRLLKVFRQAETSPIVSNAYKLNRGELSATMTFADNSGMVFEELDNDHLIQDRIVAHVQALTKTMRLKDVAVLSPMRRGVLGVEALNNSLQEALNPETPHTQAFALSERRGIYMRVGDPAIQTVNDKEKNVSNGEIGIVERIYEEEVENDLGKKVLTRLVDVCFEDAFLGEKTATYTYPEARDQLELAYAITIHKSQGSQYKTVIVPFTRDHKFMLKRNLIYTAWTRAEEQVINIGNQVWVDYAAMHNDNVLRISQIKEKLSGLRVAERV